MMRGSGADSPPLKTRSAHSFACCNTNGSFIKINACAGTLETLRRPIDVNGIGVSNASIIGERKLRRTEM